MLSTKAKIRTAQLAHRFVALCRSAAGKSMQGEFTRRGIQWVLDLDEGIDFAIFLTGAFELGTVRAYPKIVHAGDVVFDVGANIGAHTLPLAQCVGPSGHVHSFEPTLHALAKLRRNCDANPELAERIQVNHAFCTFAGSPPIPAEIYSGWPLSRSVAELHPVHLGELHAVGAPEKVLLDEYSDRHQIRRVSFIKLDVDGSEIAVLKGASERLRRDHPQILIEIAPNVFREHNSSVEELLELLGPHDYQMKQVGSATPLPLSADYLLRKASAAGSINMLLC